MALNKNVLYLTGIILVVIGLGMLVSSVGTFENAVGTINNGIGTTNNTVTTMTNTQQHVTIPITFPITFEIGMGIGLMANYAIRLQNDPTIPNSQKIKTIESGIDNFSKQLIQLFSKYKTTIVYQIINKYKNNNNSVWTKNNTQKDASMEIPLQMIDELINLDEYCIRLQNDTKTPITQKVKMIQYRIDASTRRIIQLLSIYKKTLVYNIINKSKINL